MMTPTFAGEIQLAGWSESHTGGCKVTFWLQSTADLEPFRALTTRKGNTAGHRFMAALVEIGDDELLVNPEARPVIIETVATEKIAEKERIGPLAYWLVLRCNEPEFWAWLRNEGHDCRDATDAGRWVKLLLDVVSRKEIDGNPYNEANFHKHIRGPYAKWCAARGVAA